MMFRGWKLFEIIWLSAFSVISLLLSIRVLAVNIEWTEYSLY